MKAPDRIYLHNEYDWDEAMQDYRHITWSEDKVDDNDICYTLGEVLSGSLCEICFKMIDDLNGNPDFWGVALPYQDGNGKMKYYHRGCVANIIARNFD